MTISHCLGNNKLHIVSPPVHAERLESVCEPDNPSYPIYAPEVWLTDYKCFFFCQLISWTTIPAMTHNSPAVLFSDTQVVTTSSRCVLVRDRFNEWPWLAAASTRTKNFSCHSVLFKACITTWKIIYLLIHCLPFLLDRKRRALFCSSVKLTPSPPSSLFSHLILSIRNTTKCKVISTHCPWHSWHPSPCFTFLGFYCFVS